MNTAAESVWDSERSSAAQRRPFTWSTLLWALVYPRRRQRVLPTVSGVLLILLSLGVGMAAYNAANNILFITLALLLACLVLSGVLSWLNFRRLEWRLELAPPLRAGRDAVVTVAVRNRKRVLPAYGLWFELVARARDDDSTAKAESTFTARGAEVRAALAQAAAAEVRGRVTLHARLDPLAESRVDWLFQPRRRGRLSVQLEGIGSLFPFGFLQKQLASATAAEVIVWPAPVEYRRMGAAAVRRLAGGERVPRPGSGTDLFALRRYRPGDSHRLIHWKASARTRQLLVRQFSAESAEGFAVWVQTDSAIWPRAEQFELMLSFGATFAEDLFRSEKLASVAIDNATPATIRRLADLEQWLDELAVVRRAASPPRRPPESGRGPARPNLVTFAPDGPNGVAAYCGGERIAAT